MQRGPAPRSTQIKVLHGTYRADRANASEVFPDVPDDMCPPEWISEPAEIKWNQLAPVLGANGLLTECDLDTLALYCETWARFIEANDAMTKEGMTTTAQSGYRQVSPHYTIAKNFLAELRALGDRLGLSPSARSRISVEKMDEGGELLA